MTLIGHLQRWPGKADCLSFGVRGVGFLLLFEVEEKTDTQAFDHGCCLVHQRKLLLSDCT